MVLFRRRKKPSEAEVDSMLTTYRQDVYIATLMMLQIEKSVTPPEGSAELRMTALDEKKPIEGILLRPGGWLAYGPVVNYLRLQSQACMTAPEVSRLPVPARNLPRYSQACPVPAGTG